MCAGDAYFADDEAAVVVPIGEEVDETLQAAEARLLGVLVLVRPGCVAFEVVPRKRQVHPVKGNNQVLRVVHLCKSVNHTGLLTDTPGEGLVRNAISVAGTWLSGGGRKGGDGFSYPRHMPFSLMTGMFFSK